MNPYETTDQNMTPAQYKRVSKHYSGDRGLIYRQGLAAFAKGVKRHLNPYMPPNERKPVKKGQPKPLGVDMGEQDWFNGWDAAEYLASKSEVAND